MPDLLALERGDTSVECSYEEGLATLTVGIVAKDGPEGISGRVDREDQRGRADVAVVFVAR
jgi:hypothetical protein